MAGLIRQARQVSKTDQTGMALSLLLDAAVITPVIIPRRFTAMAEAALKHGFMFTGNRYGKLEAARAATAKTIKPVILTTTIKPNESI